MSIILKSGDSADLASVDANKRLKINLPMELVDAGYSVIAGESHNGVSGEPRLVRERPAPPLVCLGRVQGAGLRCALAPRCAA
jgi:hypothetical protein